MFRKILSLLLLPCLLLTQPVMYSHAHEGSEPAGHGLRPHVHVNSSGHHSHDHHHASGEHSHYDDDEGHEHSAANSVLVAPSDHDADTIYLDGVDVVVNKRSADHHELAGWLTSPYAALTKFVTLVEDSSQSITDWTHAPPLSDGDCPLYLRQLSLLV